MHQLFFSAARAAPPPELQSNSVYSAARADLFRYLLIYQAAGV
jgi:hypothetical protein